MPSNDKVLVGLMALTAIGQAANFIAESAFYWDALNGAALVLLLLGASRLYHT